MEGKRNPEGHSPRYWRKHPQKASSSSREKENISLPPSSKQEPLEQRLLGFVEQPLFTLPVGIVGGFVGFFFYAPVFFVCGLCVVLAFHRAKVVSGERMLVQVPSYLVLSIMVVGGLYGVQV